MDMVSVQSTYWRLLNPVSMGSLVIGRPAEALWLGSVLGRWTGAAVQNPEENTRQWRSDFAYRRHESRR